MKYSARKLLRLTPSMMREVRIAASGQESTDANWIRLAIRRQLDLEQYRQSVVGRDPVLEVNAVSHLLK